MSLVSRWLSNARSSATMQSLLPAILAAVFAISLPGFNVIMAILAVVGVNMAHCAMNLLDDYFDYKADMLGDRMKAVRSGFKAFTAKYPYLVDGSASLKDLRRAIAVFGGIALACGAVIFTYRTIVDGFGSSWVILLIVALAAVLGYFYSAPPLKLSFIGLGELVIGVIFGPLLMLGTYYAAGGAIDGFIWFMSIPVGLLVMNILYTHSLIETSGDEQSDKKTLAVLLPTKGLRLAMSALLNFGPFAIIITGVLCGYLHWAYLAALVVLPRPIWLFWSLVCFENDKQIDEDHPLWFLGRFPYFDRPEAAPLHWYLIRWFTAMNTVTGTSAILSIVAIILIIL